MLRAISGLVAPTHGSISHEGVDISGMRPHRIAREGVIQVPGGQGVFPSLTVAENLRSRCGCTAATARTRKTATEDVLELFPVLRSRLGDPAAHLSGGQQQMLALGMAFLAKPDVLMIDELSLGLAPLVVEQLLAVVKQFRDRGVTVILVEQSVNVALTIADTAFFMEKGEIRFHGPTAELLERPDLLRSVFLEGAASHGAATAQTETAEADASPSDWLADAPNGGRRVRPTASTRPVVLETRGRHQAVRRDHRGRRRVAPAARRRDRRDHRPERRRQDHAVRPHLRLPRRPTPARSCSTAATSPTLRPQTAGRLGLARSFQDARLFRALTVHETVCVALDRPMQVLGPDPRDALTSRRRRLRTQAEPAAPTSSSR